MNIQEKYNFIEQLEYPHPFTEKELQLLKNLMLDSDEDIRYRIAEASGYDQSHRTEDILIELLNDDNYLVRCNACDYLSNCTSTKVLELMKLKLSKEHYLVRGTAVRTMAYVISNHNSDASEILKFIKEHLKKERNRWVRYNCYFSLYMLTVNNKYLKQILKGMKDEDYRYRCLTLNNIQELIAEALIDVTDICNMKNFLEAQLKTEELKIIQDSIKKVLRQIEDIGE